MAAFKEHCAFSFLASRDGKGDSGTWRQPRQAMGTFGRITSLKDLPDDKTIIRFVREAVKLNESGKPARSRAGAGEKKELEVPADLVAASRRTIPPRKHLRSSGLVTAKSISSG